jgi:hypothetical protein
MTRYKVGREFFYEFDDAVEYMQLEGYSVEDIEEIRCGFISKLLGPIQA